MAKDKQRPKDILTTLPIWKQGKEWIQWNPPRNHPCYEEWVKKKELDNKSKGV